MRKQKVTFTHIPVSTYNYAYSRTGTGIWKSQLMLFPGGQEGKGEGGGRWLLLVYEPYQATVGCTDNDYGCEDGCTEGQCR